MKVLLLATTLLVSCTQMKRHASQGSKKDALKVMDTTELQWSAIENTKSSEENTHVLVDSNASDSEIAAATQGNPDDADSSAQVVSNKNFLRAKHTKRVKFWIDYFTVKQRDRFQRFLNNGAMYRPIIEKILDAEGVPRELFFVGLIESGYYLGAHSRAAAVGPWQFIRGTAHRYGLAMNREMDERRDIFKATQAAAQYFRDLHNIFSSWELALAAYNSGEYGVIRRITKYKTRDYYEMSAKKYLPSETINYVPKVVAAMHVVNNAQKYGFTIPAQASIFWQKTKTVPAPKGVALKDLARRLGVSSVLLAKLNPELKTARTPRSINGGYELRVPADKHTEWMETFVAEAPTESVRIKEVEALREKVINPPPYVEVVKTTHKVRRGETLSSIARRYKLSVKELAVMNRLKVISKVRLGQTLMLKSSNDEVKVRVASATRSRKPAATPAPLVYRLRSGETLTDIARWFNTSVSAIKSANNIQKNRSLQVGHKIKIPETKKGTYVVKRGDYLMKVAEKFKLGKTALMKLNDLKSGKIYPGQRLVVNLE